MTLSLSNQNVFKHAYLCVTGLERDTYKVARQSIIDMILATEMTRHYEHLAKFVNVFTKPDQRDDDAGSGEGDVVDMALSTRENVALVKRMLIKCADVSNPTRPIKLCVEWAKRIAEEYFNQVIPPIFITWSHVKITARRCFWMGQHILEPNCKLF